jgi:hypothetical protein
MWKTCLLRPTLDGGPASKFLGMNLNSLSWTLPMTLACILVLQIMGSPFWLFFFLSKPINFPFKMVTCRFSLGFPLFGLGLSSKGYGCNLWLSSNTIALFHWTLNLGARSKVTLNQQLRVSERSQVGIRGKGAKQKALATLVPRLVKH